MLVQRHILSMSWLSSASAEEKFLLYNLITIFAQSPTTLNTAILFLIKFGSHLRFRLPLLPLCSQDRQYIIFDQILLVWQILSILLSFSLVSRFLQNKWVNFRDEKVKCTLSLAIGILFVAVFYFRCPEQENLAGPLDVDGVGCGRTNSI